MPKILIPPPRIPVIDQRTGMMSQPWYAFFAQFLQGASDDIDAAEAAAAALAVRVVTLEVEDGNLFIDHAMDVRPTAEIDELRKRIAELETEMSMITNPMAAIEELRKRMADVELDIEMVR
jgi:folate-dependent phosphoribosylglycinamide formyltransferase PurN